MQKSKEGSVDMKRIFIAFLVSVSCVGCSTITTREYDSSSGNLIRETKIPANPFVIFAQNSSGKNWIAHRGGWGFNVGYSDWGFSGGSVDDTISSVSDSESGAKCAELFPKIVGASKYSVSLSSKGVASEQKEGEE